jgi:DNA-binding GntR family transcriptional regulator
MADSTDFRHGGEFLPTAGLSGTPPLPIARRHLHDELLERLRELIIGCELRPDAKIPEKELCERFGVSRTPLREALKVLAYEGLVILQPNRGATVCPLTIPDLEDLFPIYSRLEALAGELACKHCRDEEIAEIRALHDEMLECHRQRARKRQFELNEQIHERIHLCARNPTLAVMLRSIACRIRRARIYANVAEARIEDGIREHENIIAALEARQGAQLSVHLRTHMENAFQRIKEALNGKAAV